MPLIMPLPAAKPLSCNADFKRTLGIKMPSMHTFTHNDSPQQRKSAHNITHPEQHNLQEESKVQLLEQSTHRSVRSVPSYSELADPHEII